MMRSEILAPASPMGRKIPFGLRTAGDRRSLTAVGGCNPVVLGCLLLFGLMLFEGAAQQRGDRDEEPIAPPPVPAGRSSIEAGAPLAESGTAALQATAVSGVDETVRFGISLTDLHQRTEGALAEVLWSHAESGADSMTGLGFAITDGGAELLVTVLPQSVELGKGVSVSVRRNGGVRTAELLLVDAGTGVALLRMGNGNEGGGDANRVDDAARLAGRVALSLYRGEHPEPAAVVFGYDRSGEGRAERCVPGRLAGRDSRYQGETLPTSLWRIHMHLTEPLAGGPLLDESGKVVGLMTDRALDALDEHHAVPVPVLQRLLRDLGGGRQSGVAWIGATFHLESSTPQIVGVRSDSPAQVAGLRAQDVVVSISGEPVRTLDQLADAFYYLSAGQPTQVEVLRGLEKISFRLVPTLFDNRDIDGDGVVDGGPGGASELRRAPPEATAPLDPPSAAVRSRE